MLCVAIPRALDNASRVLTAIDHSTTYAIRFAGDDCSIVVVDISCVNSPCMNNGSCSNTTSGYACTCLPAFKGVKVRTLRRAVSSCVRSVGPYDASQSAASCNQTPPTLTVRTGYRNPGTVSGILLRNTVRRPLQGVG